MSLIQAFVLGMLQGATEFLPVSSSAHLVLVPWLMHWESPGLAFDTVVHLGTAMAVIVYFLRDWLVIIGSALRPLIRGLAGYSANESTVDIPEAGLLWLILVGTFPAALIGYLLEDFFEGMFTRPVATACFLLITALLLSVSERLGEQKRPPGAINLCDALVIGFAQALAIFPGISRSGATIAAGLARGLRREAAARFSFLLATPIILGVGLFKVLELIQMGELTAQWTTLIAGFLGAVAVGSGCIHFLLRYTRGHRLYPFAIYCAGVGAFSLLIALLRG